jgi:hypothetical protein
MQAATLVVRPCIAFLLEKKDFFNIYSTTVNALLVRSIHTFGTFVLVVLRGVKLKFVVVSNS